ncbi:MAG TPA: cupredoxin domain-containing protein [Methanothrix soehngenii]|nr:cupredoxin domain-containing protein [Methanothrix soehngenii]
MKKCLSIAILILVVSLSAAAPEKTLDQQIGYDLSAVKLDQAGNPSDSAIMVSIKDNSFRPSLLSVPVGATVEWHNQDGVQHTVTSDAQGLFDSGVIMPGKKYSHKFGASGSYGYHCSIHSGMQGTITVTESAAEQDSLSAGSKGAGRGESPASWSEKPLKSGEMTGSSNQQSNEEGVAQVRSLQLQSYPVSNPAIGQSTGNLPNPSAVASSGGQAADQDSSTASSQVALQKFSQYYSPAVQAPDDQITAPAEIELKEVQPAMLYFGSAQKAVPYTQYQSYALSTGGNSLWISGSSSWTQYAVVPLGSSLKMVATSPASGYGTLYEIYPGGNLDVNGYYFYPYNKIGFYADEVGQHQLFFNIGGQPSNVIVIDVVPYQSPIQPVYDFSAVTISSSWLRGYNVYVDGSYLATEGMTGGPDGTVTVNIAGDQYHNIAIDGAGFTFSDYKYFKAGYAYQLNV